MTRDESHHVEQLLEQWRSGDADARGRLLGLLHDEMRTIARRLMRSESGAHTLQPTAVVNEACLRMLGADGTPASTRHDFLGLAAHVMRQVLVDHARRRDADKRGGDWERVSLVHAESGGHAGAGLVDAIDLDRALTKLASLSPRQAQVAELRYFGGLTVAEAAEVLGVGVSAVKDDWTVARLWLKRELEGGLAAGRGR